ncbi:aminoacyl-histidine dipeptidase [Paenibacillus sp. OV219]|uniref:aminoacyl-histidine dipeptidase n=1 Tax=Paenibacillus sp. OV219 TaxID=1884377 RepID=UPI0008B3C2A2|nr:aminoacyl-histidine dipeptidase [Paenibacillus sp. OV219]SEO74560.1 dipeptidase D [Paenibacillus sp. OV219]
MSKEQASKVYMGDCKVLQFFEELSKIPRGSGNEKAISDYVAQFAKERGCTAIQDERYNLIIKKPAAKGYEQAPAVIFQGHLDMVCEKNKSTQHDFTKDPIRFKLDGDMIYAQDTTLGADNGIGVAFSMALMDSAEMAHPALEILLTTEEETSMAGAENIDASKLSGQMMINFDSDREGVVFVSSAGGASVFHMVPIVWKSGEATDDRSAYAIAVEGLIGGHSGDDIIRERGNANKLVGRVLDDLRRHVAFDLVSVAGGMKVNAIPRESEAIVRLTAEELAAAEARIAEWNQTYKDEFEAADPGVKVTIAAIGAAEGTAGTAAVPRWLSEETKLLVIRLLALMPNGVLSMNKAIENLVRTSTNIGVISMKEDEVVFESLVRSSHRSQLDAVLQGMETLAEAVGVTFRHDHYFPGWPYRSDSKLREVFEAVYARKYGKPLQVKAIHAGLECGVLIEKMPHLDAISYGPNMYNFHTPEEHLSISSVERTWEFLQDVMRELK